MARFRNARFDVMERPLCEGTGAVIRLELMKIYACPCEVKLGKSSPSCVEQLQDELLFVYSQFGNDMGEKRPNAPPSSDVFNISDVLLRVLPGINAPNHLDIGRRY